MKQDDQRTKTIIVIALAVVLVGYIIYTIVFSGSSATQTAKKTNSRNTAAAKEGANATDQTASNIAGSVPNALFPELVNRSPRRDPFSVQASDNLQTKLSSATSKKSSKTPVLPVDPLKPQNPFKSMEKLPSLEKFTIVLPAKPMVTGVILGPNNIAVLKYDGKNYVVGEGSNFAGKYRLLKVMKDSVVLQEGSVKLRIGLGGSK